MCQLRGMSFCLDSCLSAKKKSDKKKDKNDEKKDKVNEKKDKVDEEKDKVKYGFVDLLGYNLYLPVFCNGPVVLYDQFYQQV